MSDNISKLMSHMENNKAKLFPITNKQLETQEDFIKNGYFRMLATVVQQGGLGLNNQAELFKRWIAGIQTGSTVEDYIRQALDITVDEMMSFLETCRGLDLRYRLVLDMLMLISCDETIDDQVKLVGLYAEQLGCNKEEIELLSKMAKAIVEVDGKQLAGVELEAIESEISGPIMQGIDDYAKLVAPSGMYANEKLTVIRQVNGKYLSTKVLNMIANGEIETEYIKITGAVIDLAEYKLKLVKDKSTLILEACHIIGGQHEIDLEGRCSTIKIISSNLKNFEQGILHISYNDSSCIIENSVLENCYNSEFALLRAYSGSSCLNLKNSTFLDCGIKERKSSMYFRFYLCIFNQKTVAESCNFINCQVYDYHGEVTKGALFDDFNGTNCKFENSAQVTRR